MIISRLRKFIKTQRNILPPLLKTLLRIAYAHLNLNEEEEETLEDQGFPLLAYYEPAVKNLPELERRCYDYLLYLDSLVQRKALNDYARALSPALTNHYAYATGASRI